MLKDHRGLTLDAKKTLLDCGIENGAVLLLEKQGDTKNISRSSIKLASSSSLISSELIFCNGSFVDFSPFSIYRLTKPLLTRRRRIPLKSASKPSNRVSLTSVVGPSFSLRFCLKFRTQMRHRSCSTLPTGDWWRSGRCSSRPAASPPSSPCTSSREPRPFR